MDAMVKIVSVRDTLGLDARTLLPTSAKVVTYLVGEHGPFTLSLKAEEYTPETVERKIQENINTLRGIGALPAA
jgi:hypothetical protein